MNYDTSSQAKPCVFICLRDFSSVRNLLPPPAVEALGNSGLQVVFLVPDPENKFIRSYLDKPGFVLEKLELKTITSALKAGRLIEWLRQVRFLTYGRSTPQSMGTRKYHVHVFKKEMLGAASTLIGKIYYGSVVPAAHFASRCKLFRDLIVGLEALCHNYDAHKALYAKYRPRWLAVPTLGYAHDPLLMREAKRHGAKVLSIVRSWDNTTNKGYGGFRADHVFAWNDLMVTEICKHHDIPPNQITVTGIPHWDVYFNDVEMRDRERFVKDYELDPERRIIYYAMSGPQSFRHNFDIIQLILESIRNGAIIGPVQLLVRLHPTYALDEGRWTREVDNFKKQAVELRASFGDILSFSDQKILEFGNSNILDPYNQVLNKEIFSYADVLVNIYSTQMIEGAIFDLPVITAGWHPLRETDQPISVFEKYDHVRRVLKTGAVTTTHSPDDLIAAINVDLEDGGRLRQERQNLLDQEITAFRGSAGVETAKAITALILNDAVGP
jgi:hypothetical protein